MADGKFVTDACGGLWALGGQLDSFLRIKKELLISAVPFDLI
jgi:hypothetical protein